MSYCQNCHKGKAFGHMVSHAKNRLRRTFKPNIQKLRVLRNGISISAQLCTSCIKRLKKDGKFGIFAIAKAVTTVNKSKDLTTPKKTKVEKEVVKKVEPKPKKEKAAAKLTGLKSSKETDESLNIASIVGKKI